MKPNYVAKKSIASVFSFWGIVSCVFIIPIFFLVAKIIAATNYRIEFYDDKIISYVGVINTKKKQSVFMGVTSTSIEQSLFGHMFNYGNVKVDCVGTWDIDTSGIKNPAGLEKYLQTKIVAAPRLTQFVQV